MFDNPYYYGRSYHTQPREPTAPLRCSYIEISRMPAISEAIQQSTFESPRQQVLINVLYTAGIMKNRTAQALRPTGITWQQFNCLRILRGQRGKPAPVRLIAERMLDPQSNASRLVDKLVEKGYVDRTACPGDRRQVNVTLTPEGSAALEQLSATVASIHDELAPGMTDDELLALSHGLDRFRESQ